MECISIVNDFLFYMWLCLFLGGGETFYMLKFIQNLIRGGRINIEFIIIILISFCSIVCEQCFVFTKYNI